MDRPGPGKATARRRDTLNLRWRRLTFLGQRLEVLADFFHLLAQLLNLTVQFLHRAFELRCSCGNITRAFRPPASFRCRRSFAARKSLGIPGERAGLLIQAGGSEVLDGHAEVLQPALSLVALGPGGRAIARMLR